MAGSYEHVVDDQGRLLNCQTMAGMIENGGDVYETVEEFYGMVWFLAKGNAQRVEEARQNYEDGLTMSPGKEPGP